MPNKRPVKNLNSETNNFQSVGCFEIPFNQAKQLIYEEYLWMSRGGTEVC